jgi:hypothetical protein
MERHKRQGYWQALQVPLAESAKKLFTQVGAQVPIYK